MHRILQSRSKRTVCKRKKKLYCNFSAGQHKKKLLPKKSLSLSPLHAILLSHTYEHAAARKKEKARIPRLLEALKNSRANSPTRFHPLLSSDTHRSAQRKRERGRERTMSVSRNWTGNLVACPPNLESPLHLSRELFSRERAIPWEERVSNAPINRRRYSRYRLSLRHLEEPYVTPDATSSRLFCYFH